MEHKEKINISKDENNLSLIKELLQQANIIKSPDLQLIKIEFINIELAKKLSDALFQIGFGNPYMRDEPRKVEPIFANNNNSNEHRYLLTLTANEYKALQQQLNFYEFESQTIREKRQKLDSILAKKEIFEEFRQTLTLKSDQDIIPAIERWTIQNESTNTKKADTPFQKKVINDLKDYVRRNYNNLPNTHTVKQDRFERLKKMYCMVELSRCLGDDKILEEAINEFATDTNIRFGKLRISDFQKKMVDTRSKVYYQKLTIKKDENIQEQLIELVTHLIDSNAKLEKENQESKQKNEELSKSNTTLEKENQELKQKNEELNEMLDDMQDEVDKMEGKLNNMRQRLNNMRKPGHVSSPPNSPSGSHRGPGFVNGK